MSGFTRPLFRRSSLSGATRTAPEGSTAKPRYHRNSKRPCHCLAASSPAALFQEQRLLVERLSQSSAFETPCYQQGTAEPPAAAEHLPGLVMASLGWSRC